MNAPDPLRSTRPEPTLAVPPADRPATRLKALGSLVHQLTASVRAADRFLGAGDRGERDSAGWLMSSAQALSAEIAEELDGLAREFRGDSPSTWARWRMLAHRLQATCRAADRFLEDERAEDRETGAWLVLAAQRQSAALGAALDDALTGQAVPARPSAEPSVLDPAVAIPSGIATAPEAQWG